MNDLAEGATLDEALSPTVVLGRLLLVGAMAGPAVGAATGATLGWLYATSDGAWFEMGAVVGAFLGLMLGPLAALLGFALWAAVTRLGRRRGARERPVVRALVALAVLAPSIVLLVAFRPSVFVWKDLLILLPSSVYAFVAAWVLVPWGLGLPGPWRRTGGPSGFSRRLDDLTTAEDHD